MAGTTLLTIGADVGCTDGVGGKVSRLVIDPRARTVTHLVVNDRQFQGRLVPVSLVDVATGQIRLRWTIAEFGKLGHAEVTVPLQDNDADPDSSYDQSQWRSVASRLLADPPSVSYDTLPAGEVGVRGGEHVHATDGHEPSSMAPLPLRGASRLTNLKTCEKNPVLDLNHHHGYILPAEGAPATQAQLARNSTAPVTYPPPARPPSTVRAALAAGLYQSMKLEGKCPSHPPAISSGSWSP
jgi:hypothetical protein